MVTFEAPASGFVIEKNVVEGQRVMAGERLYRLADLSTVWVEADVYERDLALVKPGAPAAVTVDAWPGETFAARVLLVAPALDPATRTARVRVALPNRGARLRPGMFANVELTAASVRGLVCSVIRVLLYSVTSGARIAQGDSAVPGLRNGRAEIATPRCGEEEEAAARA